MKNCGVVSFELVQSQADNNQDGTVDGWYIKEETISEDYLKITPKSNKSSMKKKKIMFGFILFILGPLTLIDNQYGPRLPWIVLRVQANTPRRCRVIY